MKRRQLFAEIAAVFVGAKVVKSRELPNIQEHDGVNSAWIPRGPIDDSAVWARAFASEVNRKGKSFRAFSIRQTT